jgi:hypothetical protein
MLLGQFDPPAYLDELTPEQKREWGSLISNMMDDNVGKYTGNRFFNPTAVEVAPDFKERAIAWDAFPRLIKLDSASDDERWQRADASRDVQDEYCEWSVARDSAGKVTRVTFTCEGPEYWQFLSSYDPDRVVNLYQHYVDPGVRREDLFLPDGTYEPRNRWNSTTSSGAMHLVQEDNDLGAQINIAVRATIVRHIQGRTLTQPQELIQCGGYGNPERHSDPHIGAEVNALARLNAEITLANPLGLYIEGFFPVGWESPDGSDPLDFWRVVRGTSDHAVRAVYEVPPEKGFSVGDIVINGEPIRFGAQIADFIRIKLTGVACRFGQITTPPAMTCHDGRAPIVVMGAPPSSAGVAPTSIFEMLRFRARSRSR